jgi:uncharacterized protein (DUF2267 family)
MHLQDFLGQVQHEARMSSLDEAMRATRATLTTLGERLGGGEPGNVGAQLPDELARLLGDDNATGERFSSDEFLRRVSEREEVDLPKSVFHTRAVLAVPSQAVSDGAVAHLRGQLPDDFQRLFEAGSQGAMGGD